MSYANIHREGPVAVTHTKPLRCGDCKLWQPTNAERWSGKCPIRRAVRLATAEACEEGK